MTVNMCNLTIKAKHTIYNTADQIWTIDNKVVKILTHDGLYWEVGMLNPTKRAQICVYCDLPAQGNYSINEYGPFYGPEVPLCDGCGSYTVPTMEEIWNHLKEKRNGRV